MKKRGRPPKQKFLTAKQVAKRYGMSLKWVYSCRSIPRRKAGRLVRFLEEELEVWERRHTSKRTVYGFHHFDPQPVQTHKMLKGNKESDKKEYAENEIHFDIH